MDVGSQTREPETVPSAGEGANASDASASGSNEKSSDDVIGDRTAAECFDTAFKDHNYPFHVTRETVLDYFSRSPFYDKTCNNEIVREQNKPLEAMKYMRGLEYVTIPNNHEPRLFVIVKQLRTSEHSATRKALYYVLDQTVYQAPNVRQVCMRRIRSASDLITEAMDFFSQNRSFSCVDGRTWNFPNDHTDQWRESAEAARFKVRTERGNVKKIRRINTAIEETMELLTNQNIQRPAEM